MSATTERQATWLQSPRGGYGYEIPTPCIVLTEGRRVKIAVLRMLDGAVVAKWVTPNRIRPPQTSGWEVCCKIAAVLAQIDGKG